MRIGFKVVSSGWNQRNVRINKKKTLFDSWMKPDDQCVWHRATLKSPPFFFSLQVAWKPPTVSLAARQPVELTQPHNYRTMLMFMLQARIMFTFIFIESDTISRNAVSWKNALFLLAFPILRIICLYVNHENRSTFRQKKGKYSEACRGKPWWQWMAAASAIFLSISPKSGSIFINRSKQ